MTAYEVSKMSSADRIGDAFERSLPLLPVSARDEIAKLIQPQTLAMVAGVLTAWVISHFFGVGEIVDAILTVLAFWLSVCRCSRESTSSMSSQGVLWARRIPRTLTRQPGISPALSRSLESRRCLPFC